MVEIGLVSCKLERRLWLLVLLLSSAALASLVVVLVRVILTINQVEHHLAGTLL